MSGPWVSSAWNNAGSTAMFSQHVGRFGSVIYRRPKSLFSLQLWQAFLETAAGEKTADSVLCVSALPVMGKSTAAKFTRESSVGIIGVVTGDGSVIEHHVVNHSELSATSSSPMSNYSRLSVEGPRR